MLVCALQHLHGLRLQDCCGTCAGCAAVCLSFTGKSNPCCYKLLLLLPSSVHDTGNVLRCQSILPWNFPRRKKSLKLLFAWPQCLCWTRGFLCQEQLGAWLNNLTHLSSLPGHSSTRLPCRISPEMHKLMGSTTSMEGVATTLTVCNFPG